MLIYLHQRNCYSAQTFDCCVADEKTFETYIGIRKSQF